MNDETTQGTTGGSRRMSLLDAAAQLLSSAGKPMRCKEIVDAVIAQGLWSPGTGKTPDRTLSAAFQRELKKGETSRFVRAAPGQFALRSPQSPQQEGLAE